MNWLFVINLNYWNEFLGTDQKNISCQEEYKIEKDDKIIIYTKGKKSGFIGICKCLLNNKLNINNKNIFSSKKDNKYIIEINKIEYFSKLINLKLLFKKINKDLFKSLGSFKYKYIRGNIVYNKFDNNQGINIINTLNNINKEFIININNKSIKDNNDKNNIFVKINEKKKDNKINNDFLLHVPIMVIPKVNTCLPDSDNNDKLNEFIKIYNESNVEIINNDDHEISSFFNISTVEFISINSSTSEDNINNYYKNALCAYHKCDKHEPFEFKELPFIRIIYIGDIEDDYYECYLVTWVTKKTIYEEITDSTTSSILE